MKILIASDIHGSATAAQLIVEALKTEQAVKLVLLGDLYYHGPRNGIPQSYNPKAVAELFNSIKECLIVTRGNCDADIDVMISEFEFRPHLLINTDGYKLFFSHGDRYSPTFPPPGEFDVMFYGHYHVATISKEDGFVAINPGSATLSTPKSYAIFDKGTVQIKDLNSGNVLKEITVD